MQFDVERRTLSTYTCLRVTGELDLATAPQLGAAADEALAEPVRSLVIDLTPTTFMDSSGARELTQVTRRAWTAGVPLQVVCPRGNAAVRLVIDLLELHTVVPVVESPPRDGTAWAVKPDGP